MTTRSLIFTSMGARPDVLSSWIGNNSKKNNYDIWVYSYDKKNTNSLTLSGLLSKVSFYNFRPGASKFQNLAHAYYNYPERFRDYTNFLILDDDISLTPSQIHHWIDIHNKYSLDISQPAFKSGPGLQVSWKCTLIQPSCVFHYTSFIEMTAPMFSHTVFHNWIKEFIPYANRLAGWGTDLFYMLTLDPFKPQAYAVIDDIVATNPTRSNHQGTIGNKNGMKGLISKKERKRQWEQVRRVKGWNDNRYPILQSGHLARTDESHGVVIYKTPYYHESVNLHPIS